MKIYDDENDSAGRAVYEKLVELRAVPAMHWHGLPTQEMQIWIAAASVAFATYPDAEDEESDEEPGGDDDDELIDEDPPEEPLIRQLQELASSAVFIRAEDLRAILANYLR